LHAVVVDVDGVLVRVGAISKVTVLRFIVTERVEVGLHVIHALDAVDMLIERRFFFGPTVAADLVSAGAAGVALVAEIRPQAHDMRVVVTAKSAGRHRHRTASTDHDRQDRRRQAARSRKKFGSWLGAPTGLAGSGFRSERHGDRP